MAALAQQDRAPGKEIPGMIPVRVGSAALGDAAGLGLAANPGNSARPTAEGDPRNRGRIYTATR
jgi:hypothetical protein